MGIATLELTADPAKIKAYQDALAARIRVSRTLATHGDIFLPEIRVYFRPLLAPEFKGEDGRDIRAKLRDDAPAPDAVPLQVDVLYPSGTPFPTTPAPVLIALPPRPRGLEYRIIGRRWRMPSSKSFNGALRDECLNSHVFALVSEAQRVLDAWRDDYNLVRPHSSLQDRTPAAVGAMWVDSREPRESTAANEDRIEPEIAGRFVTMSPL